MNLLTIDLEQVEQDARIVLEQTTIAALHQVAQKDAAPAITMGAVLVIETGRLQMTQLNLEAAVAMIDRDKLWHDRQGSTPNRQRTLRRERLRGLLLEVEERVIRYRCYLQVNAEIQRCEHGA